MLSSLNSALIAPCLAFYTANAQFATSFVFGHKKKRTTTWGASRAKLLLRIRALHIHAQRALGEKHVSQVRDLELLLYEAFS
jgi:hypothetical protein